MTDPISKRIDRIAQKVANRGMVLGRPASESDVSRFEQQFRISLPEDYRHFIVSIGDGCCDGPPSYGLSNLAGSIKDEHGKLLRPDLPFPLVKYWVWEDDELNWASDLPEVLVPVFYHGHLNLGTDGCGMDWILIVNGSERGQMWNRADVGAQPCAPRRDFISWFEYWLDGKDDWWADFKAEE